MNQTSATPVKIKNIFDSSPGSAVFHREKKFIENGKGRNHVISGVSCWKKIGLEKDESTREETRNRAGVILPLLAARPVRRFSG